MQTDTVRRLFHQKSYDLYIYARENSCKNGPGTVRCPADLLQMPAGTIRHRTVPGRTSADVIIYRRRPAPVRYVTMQEIFFKSSGAQVIKFAGNVQIAEIVRCQFYV